MTRGLILTTAALMLFTGIAFSSAYSLYYDHLISLAVPAASDGKTIESAEARIGVLTTRRFQPGHPFPGQPFVPYWSGEKTVQLEKQGDRFVVRTRLSVTENDAGPTMGPVMVEYRLKLTNGQTLTTKAQPITVSATHNASNHNDYSTALARELARFTGPVPAESGCVSVSLYVRGVQSY